MKLSEEEELVLNEIIREIPSIGQAIRFGVRRSGLSDKQVYLEIGMDAPFWSRCINDLATMPPEKYKAYIAVTGEDAPLRWLAYQCGYEIKPSINYIEEQLRKEREEKENLKKENELLKKMVGLKKENK